MSCITHGQERESYYILKLCYLVLYKMNSDPENIHNEVEARFVYNRSALMYINVSHNYGRLFSYGIDDSSYRLYKLEAMEHSCIIINIRSN